MSQQDGLEQVLGTVRPRLGQSLAGHRIGRAEIETPHLDTTERRAPRDEVEREGRSGAAHLVADAERVEDGHRPLAQDVCRGRALRLASSLDEYVRDAALREQVRGDEPDRSAADDEDARPLRERLVRHAQPRRLVSGTTSDQAALPLVRIISMAAGADQASTAVA